MKKQQHNASLSIIAEQSIFYSYSAGKKVAGQNITKGESNNNNEN